VPIIIQTNSWGLGLENLESLLRIDKQKIF